MSEKSQSDKSQHRFPKKSDKAQEEKKESTSPRKSRQSSPYEQKTSPGGTRRKSISPKPSRAVKKGEKVSSKKLQKSTTQSRKGLYEKKQFATQSTKPSKAAAKTQTEKVSPRKVRQGTTKLLKGQFFEEKISFTRDTEEMRTRVPSEDIRSSAERPEEKKDVKPKDEEEQFEEAKKNVHKALQKVWNIPIFANFRQPHIVLATQYLVPDLPMGLFELLGSLIENIAKAPVALVHQRIPNRRIATELVNIAVMRADEDWKHGQLLPASFVFEHKRNKNRTPHVYADIIVPRNRPKEIQRIEDLRGCKCAMTSKRDRFTAEGLFVDELRSMGEELDFFEDVLEATSQVHVLDMIRNNQVDMGIVDSPVFYHYKKERNVKSLEVLESLGPLPPYRIMAIKNLDEDLFTDLSNYLATEVGENEFICKYLSFYNVSRFAENRADYYEVEELMEEPAEAEPAEAEPAEAEPAEAEQAEDRGDESFSTAE